MEGEKKFNNLPRELLHEHNVLLNDYLTIGLNYRWKGIIYTAFVLIVMLVTLALIPNIADWFMLAVAISVSTLCVVAAIYTAIATLLVQRDLLSTLLIHYGEIYNNKGNIKDND